MKTMRELFEENRRPDMSFIIGTPAYASMIDRVLRNIQTGHLSFRAAERSRVPVNMRYARFISVDPTEELSVPPVELAEWSRIWGHD